MSERALTSEVRQSDFVVVALSADSHFWESMYDDYTEKAKVLDQQFRNTMALRGMFFEVALKERVKELQEVDSALRGERR